jgi:Flp pilus assembly protein TadD
VLFGCQHTEPLPRVAAPAALRSEPTPKLTAPQVADVKISYGRILENRGAFDQAQAVYLEAVKLDPGRADAYARLGVLCDQQCKLDEANAWHLKAINAQPKNADFYCNLGYNLYLQGNLPEAEKSLRQCLALAPGHARGHNNLGMILARTDRPREALVEFRLAGCNEVDAQANLAFAFTLERRWLDARACFERILATDPGSTATQKSLQELNGLMAKADQKGMVRQGDSN